MTTILTATDQFEVDTHNGLWMTADDAARVTGWALKPEGMCRDELCVPLPPEAVKDGEVDVAAFWRKLGGHAISNKDGDVWALGVPHDERNAKLQDLEAPDFTLPDIDGTERRLSELRGKKVFLATWASW